MISKEHFQNMIEEMDSDKSGTVTKNEFEVVYKKMFPKTTNTEFDKVWDDIDENKDGDLQVWELAKYYGFSWDGETCAEMTDEQILQVLQMNSLLVQEEDEKKAKERAAKEAAKSPPAARASGLIRDKTVVVITDKKNKDLAGLADMKAFMEACELGEIKEKDDKTDIRSLLEKKNHLDERIQVRIADDKGEMPLHKLARVCVPDDDEKKKVQFKQICKDLVNLQKAQCQKAGVALASDINCQDKQGRTPLFFAVEKANMVMIDFLFKDTCLEMKDRPDVLLVNTYGSTVLHAACNANKQASIERLFMHISEQRKKMLLKCKDKIGRQPLHITAFTDTSQDGDVNALLIKHGAKNDAKDAAGNKPSELAGKSQRRKSKEMIEEMTGTSTGEGNMGPRERRRSRDSKESITSTASADGVKPADDVKPPE